MTFLLLRHDMFHHRYKIGLCLCFEHSSCSKLMLRAKRGHFMVQDTGSGSNIRNFWQPTVDQRIRDLEPQDRAQARSALSFLMKNGYGAYKEFKSEHDRFCFEFPDASRQYRQHRRRRLQFIESVGLECALWPNLFWIT